MALAGCGGDSDSASEPASPRVERERPSGRVELEPPRCQSGVEGCRSASGRIVYVERVDPDGDRDAHFVLASRESVTAPGITVVDVPPELRPTPLPGVGDELAAAGPVQTGSAGQRQIHALDVSSSR